jgi:hypothetical protein
VVSNESTRLELRSANGCSSVDDFKARVARRSSRISFVTEGGNRSLLVEIQGAAGGLRGAVTLVERDGSTRTRRLKANTCEEAAEGLALIATVTLDPDALLGAPEPEPEPKPETKPEPEPKPQPKPRPAPARAPPRLQPEDAARLRFSFGLGAAVLARVAPELAPGGSLEGALELNPGRVVSPFFRLSVAHAQRRDVDGGVGLANFAFTLPTLDVCPVRIGTRTFAVRPCAYGSVGVLKVWGEDAFQRETHSRVFASAGGALWLGFRLSEAIEIIADARAVVPLRRNAFAFDDVVFWRTPTLGFSSVVGLAVGFP